MSSSSTNTQIVPAVAASAVPPNGTASKLLWYLLTGVTAVAVATISSWATSVDRRLDETLKGQIAHEKAVVEINTKLDMLVQQTRQLRDR
jgi:hypothetical protein